MSTELFSLESCYVENYTIQSPMAGREENKMENIEIVEFVRN